MNYSLRSSAIAVLAIFAIAAPSLHAQNIKDSVKMTLSIFQYVNTDNGVNCGNGVYAIWPNVLPNGTYSSYSRVATEGMYVPAGWGETTTDPKHGIVVPDGYLGHLATWSWSDGPGSNTAPCAEGVSNTMSFMGGAWTVLNAKPFRITEWYAVYTIPSGTPVALFVWKQTMGLTVAFDASFESRQSHEADATAPGNRRPVVNYVWDFGDGQNGSGAQPNHEYSEAGTYSVKLTVTDDDGQTDTLRSTVTVEPRSLRVQVSAPQEGYEGDTVEIVATVANVSTEPVHNVVARREFTFSWRLAENLNLEGSRRIAPELTPVTLPSGEDINISKDQLGPGESIKVRRKYVVKKRATYRAPDSSKYVPVTSIVEWDMFMVSGTTGDGKPVAVERPCRGPACADNTRIPNDGGIQIAVNPSATVTIKPEKQKSWEITVTEGKEKTPLAGATIHVSNQLLGQADEIAGTSDASGKFKYTFTAPKDEEKGEYALDFWATKDGFAESELVQLKVKYEIGDQIVYYECAGLPIIEFDAGDGNKFEIDDDNPDLYRETGSVTINRLVRVDGTVEVNNRNGAENVTLNGRMYIPSIPLPGGSTGDLVFYNGPLSYNPVCENVITSLVASMEKEVAGVKLQLQKLGFEGGMSALALRVAGKASFQALRSTCTPPLSNPDPNNPQEESVELELEMLVNNTGIAEFKLKSTNLSVGPSFCLKDLLYEYYSETDILNMGGKFIIGKDTEPWFSLALKAGFIKGKFNSIEGETEFPCMPLGTTPLCIKGVKGFLKGMAAPPLSFELQGVMTSKLNEDLFEFSAGGRYTDPAKLALVGGLTLFKVDRVSADNPWQVELADAKMEFDLPAYSASIGGVLNIAHFGDKKWIFSGEGNLGMTLTEPSGIDFRGTAKGSFTIPDGDDMLRQGLKQAGFVLPWTLAATDILMDNGTCTANLDIRGAIAAYAPNLAEAFGKWNASIGINGTKLPDVSFGSGFVPLSRTAQKSGGTGIASAAGDRIDTFDVATGTANVFVGVVGDKYTPTTYLISPTGTRYDATPSDSSMILISTQGKTRVFWMVPDPAPGKWVFGVTNAKTKDAIFVYGVPEERPFDVTATGSATSVAVNWSESSFAGDSVRVFLDRDGDGYDGQWLGTYTGNAASVTIPLPDRLQDCSYHLYAIRTGPSGFSRDYAPNQIEITKNYLQAPTNIVAIRNHRTGRTRISWDRSVDANAQGYAIYVRYPDGKDSMYASSFRDQEAATIDIADHTDKNIYMVTFDEEGRRGCPSEAVSISLSGAEPAPGPQLPPSLELSAIPNPYSDQTTIGFALAAPSAVKIQVHDVNGKEIATVANRQFEAGDHALVWNSEDIPAGVYVISIIAGKRSEALVTILVR